MTGSCETRHNQRCRTVVKVKRKLAADGKPYHRQAELTVRADFISPRVVLDRYTMMRRKISTPAQRKETKSFVMLLPEAGVEH